MKIQIELLTEDKKTRELCEAYWKTDAGGNFSHTLADLAKRFRVNQNSIINGAKINCRVFFKDMLCKDAFKKLVLREVGLELKQITNQDLQNFRRI
jgi:hypothetical protein